MNDITLEWMYNLVEMGCEIIRKDEIIVMTMSMHVKRREKGEEMIWIM